MEGFFGLLIIGAIIGIIIYYKNKEKEAKLQQEEKERQEAEEKRNKELEILRQTWDEKKNDIMTNGLPQITTDTLNLRKNEICHFMGDAYFCKIKQQTVGYEGGSRGVSFRVMKGISFRVGNYKGHYLKEEITEKTSGLIYLTNKKIVFTGIKNSCVIKYDDVVNLNNVENMLQIQTGKKTFLFQIDNSIDFLVRLEYIINKPEEENKSTDTTNE